MEKGLKVDAWPKIALLYIKYTAVCWFDFEAYMFMYLKPRILLIVEI